MTFVSISGDTMTVKDGSGKQTTKKVAANATVTINSKAARLEDLQPGDNVTLAGDPASTVTVSR